MVHGVVLLIGPPGVGKSTLGRALVAQHAAGQLGQGLEAGLSLSFLSVGQVLRDEGLVDAYMRLDSTANLTALQHRARSLIDEACCKLQLDSACAKAGSSRCITLQRADSTAVCVSSGSGLSGSSIQRNSERLVEQRQAKWAANAAPLIELFSSLGLLVEVDMYLPSEASGTDTLPPPPQPTPTKQLSRRGRQQPSRPVQPVPSGCLHGVTKVPGPRAGPLAAIGCTTESGDASSNSAGASGGATGGGAGSTCLQRAGWSGPDGRLFLVVQGLLVARAVPPVVSTCLVSSTAERDTVLHEAERSSGLRDLGQCIAVPSQVVATPGDASWLAYLSRYCVSRKCDGTRHLLLMTSGGQAYLLNRAGTLYRYPLQCSSSTAAVQSTEGSVSPIAQKEEKAGSALLPAGTVLDGELVWVGEASSGRRRGFFLAFDVLSLGEQQQRAWSLPLDERLQLLSWLQKAEECPQLQAAAALLQAVGSTATSSAAAPSLVKKQQAAPPGQDSIMVLRKRHLPGVELIDAAALQQQGRRLGVMAVPSLSGPYDELLHRLSRGCCGDAPASTGRPQSASTKGWVIMTAEGKRRKLVQESYKCASLAAKALHPLAVWDAVL
ncbi:hypothetical protein FOA52_003414 [Chlamydomonas sp. UWO 241]|nr:hypothetical protein FOA52_003414 [Chlamydomonas sp. UWO 241]